VTRCATALEEAGSDYEIVPINFATAEHKSPEHLVRNVQYLPDPPSPVVVVCLFVLPGN
jgi:glutathione S-transferase